MKEDKSTSWVADARKLLQDFVAPEVRAVTAHLDAADKIAAERHTALLASNQERHAALLDMFEQRDKVAADRHALLLDKIDATRREIDTARRELSVQIKLAIAESKLEALHSSQARTPPTPQ